ncbi:FxSxx-COOH system tetratricopeptide repeat protein [Streptomyces sp. ME02-7008A-1]|uniref:FxSxx-COOH system tetratricopeptide repeat protein n=1 Tax=unclassified Streptomyces TaxID=2593676 RepID=UPI0029AE4AD9|nr:MULTISPECIES: FxSxx-COOH system tetratricopeptide repeat protein [unclassified Streptomyces]MDX3186222.1 FxSxx-COOH system tetratricopeptide repeat protein [Streptomyces sp. ME02-7008A-1]MDX3307329.1 FxSxx-COOH system tetratricopeptide repeat protein [Streptomyces sp. ME02-7008A]
MTPRWPRRSSEEEAAGPAGSPGTIPAGRQEPEQQVPSVRVTARGDGIAAGNDVSHNAAGPHSQVVDNRQTHIHHTPREVTWPLEIGAVPALASAFQPRSALRERVDAVRAQGVGAVLTQVLSGGGGVGKSQLAAAYASEALHDGTDLVLWAPAVEVQQVVTLYAQAAVRVAAPGATGEDPETDARALLSWLATTDRRWLVVLDDITDPAGMTGWWPTSRTGTGWILATTRLHDASLTGNGRRRIQVDVYPTEEASAYLRARLTDDDAGHLLDGTVEDLAAALGYLPLALGHAAAYMLNQDLTCTQYLALFNDNNRRLEHVLPEAADAEGYGRQIATTLLLSLDAAQRTEPIGLALPALQLAAHLDPAGHPHTLWNTPTVLAHLTDHRDPVTEAADDAPDVTAEEAESVLRVLHRYALITSDRRQEPRAVRIHALTARAARETTPTETLSAVALASADALLQIWPSLDQAHPGLAAALRTSADHLHQHTADHLWQGEGHGVLVRSGISLLQAGLTSAAVKYWEHLSRSSQQMLGPDHHSSLVARSHLASSYWQAGRTDEVITLEEVVLADCERILGFQHRDTLIARSNLAISYRQTGRIKEALFLQEAVLTGSEQVLGRHHPHTLAARNNLATSYQQIGRTAEAITLQEAVLADSERILGRLDPSTITIAISLASSYLQAGHTTEAIHIGETALTDCERILGLRHPETLKARNNLANSYRQAGRAGESLTLQEAVLTASEQVLGLEHPDTLTGRNNLAASYWHAGWHKKAISVGERALADCQRILGLQHPNTLTARHNLATCYLQAGHTARAITLLETLCVDAERLFGAQHPNTLTALNNLASAHLQAGS